MFVCVYACLSSYILRFMRSSSFTIVPSNERDEKQKHIHRSMCPSVRWCIWTYEERYIYILSHNFFFVWVCAQILCFFYSLILFLPLPDFLPLLIIFCCLLLHLFFSLLELCVTLFICIFFPHRSVHVIVTVFILPS